MNRDEIIDDIKQRKTFQPDDRVLDRIMTGVDLYEAQNQKQASSPRVRILKPAFVFIVITILLVSSFAVTAAVNEDIRGYLISIFGGNPNSVEGELIGAKAQSDGVELTVDAVVAEGDSLFMVYTLKDSSNNIFSNSTSINRFTFNVNGNANYGATYNSIINNGEKNYMILNSDNIMKGVQKIQFSIESVKTPDPSKEFVIPAETYDYKFPGVDGYSIEYVKMNNNRLEAAINISDKGQYVHNFNIYAKNIKTGEIIRQKRETIEGGSRMRWFSDTIDNGKPEDYVFVISFDRIFTFEKPLLAQFSADFSKKPVKIIKPDNIQIDTAAVEKVTVNQMSIMIDYKDMAEDSVIYSQKPIEASQSDDIDLADESSRPPLSGKKINIQYEDGTNAQTISIGTTHSTLQGIYRTLIILNGSLDYSKKPVLTLGDAAIPLY